MTLSVSVISKTHFESRKSSNLLLVSKNISKFKRLILILFSQELLLLLRSQKKEVKSLKLTQKLKQYITCKIQTYLNEDSIFKHLFHIYCLINKHQGVQNFKTT